MTRQERDEAVAFAVAVHDALAHSAAESEARGAAAERSRIRRELAAAIEECDRVGARSMDWNGVATCVPLDSIAAALDRICPEAPEGDTTLETAVLDGVVKERERCVAAVDAVAEDASCEGMSKVDDLLSNLAAALTLGLSPAGTLAYLKRQHGEPAPASSVHDIPGVGPVTVPDTGEGEE